MPRFCVVCKELFGTAGSVLDPQRAEGDLETELCLEHSQMIEKWGGEFITVSHQERTSKAGSIKRNYGGVSTQRVRNRAGIRKLLEECRRQAEERKT